MDIAFLSIVVAKISGLVVSGSNWEIRPLASFYSTFLFVGHFCWQNRAYSQTKSSTTTFCCVYSSHITFFKTSSVSNAFTSLCVGNSLANPDLMDGLNLLMPTWQSLFLVFPMHYSLHTDLPTITILVTYTLNFKSIANIHNKQNLYNHLKLQFQCN
jgi:hypothetical protein